MTFKKAVRSKAKLRLAITGPSGSGKTYSALQIAKGLGGKIALIDTEHGSASLYCDLLDFDTLELEAPFEPERYIKAIKDAESAGYDVLVIDSISHEWNGKGGILEIHEAATKAQSGGNSYMAWGKVTPRHNAFIEAILQAGLHVIVTMRSKQDFVLQDRNGKQVPQKVGMAPVQRDGFEYEMTVVFDISVDGHMASVSKDRTQMFDGRNFVVSPDTGKQLIGWLETGKEVKDWKAIGTDLAQQFRTAETVSEVTALRKKNKALLEEMKVENQSFAERIDKIIDERLKELETVRPGE